MSQFQSWKNEDAMQLLQQQLLHQPNPLGQIYIPNVTNERILPQNYQLPLTTTIQSHPQHPSQSPNYPSQINPFQVGQFLPEQVFSQECTTNYQHGSGLTSLDPTEEKILFGSDDDVSSSTRVTSSQGNFVTRDGFCGTFASINSGSWSALMQDAVEASSSETGLHEEWSGLSFQKPEEPSISNNSSTLTANQPSNFVVNEGHTWNLPYMAVSGSQNLFNLSAQYSSVISENPHFAANQQMKETEEELRHQGAFQSNCSDGASIGPLANFYSQHIAPMASGSMLEPNREAERTRSNVTASLDIPKSVTADSSTSHENSLKQISLQNQFVSNQPLSHNQYPSVHLNLNQPQIDHYISQSDILDSKSTLCSQDAVFGSFDFTKIASNTINNACKSVIENSLDSMVTNMWNVSLVQQNLASIHPAKVTSSMLFQSKMEGDKSLPGIANVSTHPPNQDQKQDIHDNARMLSISSYDVRNLKEHSHFSGNIGSSLRTVQGSPCTKDPVLQFGPKSPKRGCNSGPHEVGPRPKKQRAETSTPVSWFRVVDGSHQRLCIARIKEHGWPQATNRLSEKVEDITKLKEDVPSETLTKKRLILTTQLTWQLFPGLQYKYLTEDATLAYQKITYCVSRSALEEACTLISSRDISSLHSRADNRMLEKFGGMSAGGSTLSEAAEKIMQKSTTLESHFLRLDKRSCLVDLKLIWQELERYAIVSCLGKFHTQSRHVNPEGTSNPQTAPRRHLAQRHATLVVLQIDTASLHGVPCLSL